MQHISAQVETWKPVVGYEGYYEVSNHGRLRSLDRIVYAGQGRTRRHSGGNLNPAKGDTGYLEVRLSREGKSKIHKVHRLVLAAFVGPCPPGMEGCHNDGDRMNANLDNLRWDTRVGNFADKELHGTCAARNKTHCPRGHLLVEPNLDGYQLKKGYRSCKACVRARSWAHGRVDRDFVSEAHRRYRLIMK